MNVDTDHTTENW